MNYRRFVLAVFVLLLVGQAYAQSGADLDRLDEKLGRFLESRMPGWTRTRVEPIQGSKGQLIQVWSVQNRGVRISVSLLKTTEDAKEAMRSFVRDVKKAQSIGGLGDEAYTWGFQQRLLIFRRGRTVVNLEVGADVDADPDARTITWGERRAREQSEVKRITSEFENNLLLVIDLP